MNTFPPAANSIFSSPRSIKPRDLGSKFFPFAISSNILALNFSEVGSGSVIPSGCLGSPLRSLAASAGPADLTEQEWGGTLYRMEIHFPISIRTGAVMSTLIAMFSSLAWVGGAGLE